MEGSVQSRGCVKTLSLAGRQVKQLSPILLHLVRSDTQRQKKRSDTQRQKKRSDTQRQKKRSDTQRQKKRSDTQRQKKRSDTQRQKKRSDTQRQKKRSDTQRQKKRSDTQRQKKRSDTQRQKKRSDTQRQKKRSDTQRQKKRSTSLLYLFQSALYMKNYIWNARKCKEQNVHFDMQWIQLNFLSPGPSLPMFTIGQRSFLHSDLLVSLTLAQDLGLSRSSDFSHILKPNFFLLCTRSSSLHSAFWESLSFTGTLYVSTNRFWTSSFSW